MKYSIAWLIFALLFLLSKGEKLYADQANELSSGRLFFSALQRSRIDAVIPKPVKSVIAIRPNKTIKKPVLRRKLHYKYIGTITSDINEREFWSISDKDEAKLWIRSRVLSPE
jgi:hypothetical protein